jgi:dTDP-4-dehydrorhamnose reductase
MKVLVFGATGMLGHRLCQVLTNRFEVWATFRQKVVNYSHIVGDDKAISGVFADDLISVEQAIESVQPDVVVNCVGVIKQRDEAKKAIPSIRINALFPHYLAELCNKHSSRLIQISTDCVFSGLRGNYVESDIPDPVDVYGRTKLLGEVSLPGCLTIRTSVIGWQLNTYTSLLEWFAMQRGRRIKGFCKAVYSGFSTTIFSGILGDIIEKERDLNGVYHISSAPISKYDLLIQLRDTLGWNDIAIEPDNVFFCDRSLNSARFISETEWNPPTWKAMIAGLAAEWVEYHPVGRA